MSLVPQITNPPSGSNPQASPFTTASNDNPMQQASGRPTTTTTAATRSESPNQYSHHEGRPPYLHAMIAGGLGGLTGDMSMHSLDTVKTRQQGAPNALKYATTSLAYRTILREEGFARGLYAGVTPAFMGSLPGTVIFFGTYEWSKRHLIDFGVPHALSYLASGFIADLFASVVYVPSEVLKTRLQLQGRYNNPAFKSGYNYRSTLDAARTIVRTEGAQALFHGYKATLMRDLPFSALQFAFYEQFQYLARQGRKSKDIGIILEIATGAMAGGLAGVITCPLDVVKTRLQTQVQTGPGASTSPPISSAAATAASNPIKLLGSQQQKRGISTSSPSTTTPKAGAMKLNTSSVVKGLVMIYRSEGIQGWFRGVGPRAVWTSVQSSIMLVLYQSLLKQMARHSGPGVSDTP